MIPPKGFVLGKPELPGDGTLNWKKMPRRKKRQCQPGVKIASEIENTRGGSSALQYGSMKT
jgi:hypothetical protein